MRDEGQKESQSQSGDLPGHHHFEEGIKLLFRGLLPIILLTAGLAILFLRLPGWSMIFGIPMIIIGCVFLIHTYDEVVRKSYGGIPQEIAKCAVCGKETPKYPGQGNDSVICSNCKREKA